MNFDFNFFGACLHIGATNNYKLCSLIICAKKWFLNLPPVWFIPNPDDKAHHFRFISTSDGLVPDEIPRSKSFDVKREGVYDRGKETNCEYRE